jgi:hypothetical protein
MGSTSEENALSGHHWLLLPINLCRPLHRPEAGLIQRMPKPRDNHPAHQRRIAEADFGFGGVDVHIDLAWWQIYKQRHYRVPITRQHFGIGTAHRADQQPVLH